MNIEAIEIQKGKRIDFEDLVNGVSKMDNAALESLIDTLKHIMAGRKSQSPSEREKNLLDKIEHVVPAFVQQRYHVLHSKLQKEKISEAERQELLEITAFMEDMSVERLHLMAELAALKQVSLKDIADLLRKKRYGYAKA